LLPVYFRTTSPRFQMHRLPDITSEVRFPATNGCDGLLEPVPSLPTNFRARDRAIGPLERFLTQPTHGKIAVARLSDSNALESFAQAYRRRRGVAIPPHPSASAVQSTILMASDGHSDAHVSHPTHSFGKLTTDFLFSILKTFDGQTSVQLPHPVHFSASTTGFVIQPPRGWKMSRG